MTAPEAALGTVNLSSAAFRTALFWRHATLAAHKAAAANDPGAFQSLARMRNEVLVPLLGMLRGAILDKFSVAAHLSPYDIAIVIYAYAACDAHDARLFDALLRRALPLLAAHTPTDLSHIAWACGRTRHAQPPVVWDALAATAAARVAAFKPVELANLVWGLFGMPDAPQRSTARGALLTTAAARLAAEALVFPPDATARLLWCFARDGFGAPPPRRHSASASGAKAPNAMARAAFSAGLLALSSPRAAEEGLCPQDVANAVWAAARVKAPVDVAVARRLARWSQRNIAAFGVLELAALSHGCGTLGLRNTPLLDALAARAAALAPRMGDKELCMVLWALGKLAHIPRPPVGADGANDDDGAAEGPGVAVAAEDSGSLAAIAAEFLSRAPRLRPLTLSNVIKALGKLGGAPPDREVWAATAASAAAARMPEFGMAELSNLLWGFAELGWTADRGMPVGAAVTGMFVVAEQHVIEQLGVCSCHHVRTLIKNLQQCQYSPIDLVAAARHHGFLV